MVKEVIGYTLICDECGIDYCTTTSSLYSSYPIVEDAELFAEGSDWHVEDGRHYCFDCWRIIQEKQDEIDEREIRNTALEEEHDYKQATR